MLLEVLQEPRPRERLLVADEFGAEGLHERGGVHLADAEEPLDVALGENRRSSCSSWLMGVGDGEEPAGTVQVLQRQVAGEPSGGGVDGFTDVVLDPEPPVAGEHQSLGHRLER